ncbi:MAG: hypothetical protein IKQ91_07860 [Oscillospiraceae bacterium]|nr:hypothetical protein [Oscillospiraceae bacterium]
MSEQISITPQQHQKIIEYLDEARSKHMHLLYICIAGSVLLALPGLMLLGGYGGNRYSLLAGIGWFVSIVGTVILLLTGYQRVFGSNAPINQFKQHNYSCERITVSQLSGSEGRPPYLVTDSLGKQYVCPVYLEMKAMRQGGTAIGIYLSGSTNFVVHDASADTF